MVQNISTAQAVSMYLAVVQQQYAAAPPLQRILKTHFGPVVNGKQQSYSLMDILRELQNGSQLGKQMAVQYAQGLMDANNQPRYAVTS